MSTMKYLHINEHSVLEVRAMIPRHMADHVITDGDCGNEWGEVHENICPQLHVIIVNPDAETIRSLNTNRVRYTVDLDDSWGDTVLFSPHGWVERPCASVPADERPAPISSISLQHPTT